MSKRALSETDICDRFITPALHQAGWLRKQILRELAFAAWTDHRDSVVPQVEGKANLTR